MTVEVFAHAVVWTMDCGRWISPAHFCDSLNAGMYATLTEDPICDCCLGRLTKTFVLEHVGTLMVASVSTFSALRRGVGVRVRGREAFVCKRLSESFVLVYYDDDTSYEVVGRVTEPTYEEHC